MAVPYLKESLLSTHNQSSFSSWAKRIFLLLLFLEFLYVVTFNVLLNSSYLRDRVNAVESNKIQIKWESAWTFYPARIHAENLTVEGESGSKAWQADIGTASASFSLLSLIGHSVKVCDVEVKDISYKEQAVSSSSDASASVAESAMKEETGNLETAGTEGGQKQHNPWPVELKGIKISGDHTIESQQFKARLTGGIDADLHIVTEEGLLSADKGAIDITVQKLLSAEGEEIAQNAKIKTAFRISPLAYKEERKGSLLEHLTLDSAVTAQMKNLSVFDAQLKRVKGVQLSGKGTLKSRIRLESGKLLPDTKVQIDADKLFIRKNKYSVRGNGAITLAVEKNSPDLLEAKVTFGKYMVYRDEGIENGKIKVSLFHGKGLTLLAKANTTLYPKAKGQLPLSSVGFELPPVVVDDLSLLQQYIPKKWNLALWGGKGTLQARATILEKELNASVKLLSKKTEIRFNNQALKSDLNLDIRAKVAMEPSLYADLTGSSISLTNTILAGKKESNVKVSKPWHTKVAVEKGKVALLVADMKGIDTLPALLKKYKPKEIFANAEGELTLGGDISRLEWINLLAKSSLDLSLKGSGIIEGKLLVKQGKLMPKSGMRILSKNLEVGLLDYLFDGEGSLIVQKGERDTIPLLYAMEYSNATLKHKNDKEPMIEAVKMRLERAAGRSNSNGSRWDKPLHLQIDSAKVKSLALYNQYLPKNSPFTFISGSADLKSDITLENNNTQGYITLVSDGMKMRVDEQEIAARLRVDTRIVSGEPQKMLFDISGSSILLDQARVAGEKAAHSDADWRLKIDMKKAEIIWKKPLWLKAETSLAMKDSKPIVAMIENGNSKFSFITKMLVVENLQGEAKITMENQAIRIPYAMVKGGKVEVDAKAIFDSSRRDGVLLVKHPNFRVLVKKEGEKKSFDLFSAQKSFDSYKLPALAPAK